MDDQEQITLDTAQVTLERAYSAREHVGGVERAAFLAQAAQTQALICIGKSLDRIVVRLDEIAERIKDRNDFEIFLRS